MSFLRNLVRRSAGLPGGPPLRPHVPPPVFPEPASTEGQALAHDLAGEAEPPAAPLAPAAEPGAARAEAVPDDRTQASPPRLPADPVVPVVTPPPPDAAGEAVPVGPLPTTRVERTTVLVGSIDRPPGTPVESRPDASVAQPPVGVEQPLARSAAQATAPAPQRGVRAAVAAAPTPAAPAAAAAPEPPPAASAPVPSPLAASAAEVPTASLRTLGRRHATTASSTRVEPRVVARPAPRPPREPETDAEPAIEVTIGRVEVRAPRPADPPSPAPPPAPERGFADLALARRGLDRRWY